MNYGNALQTVLSWVALPYGGEAGAGAKAAVMAGKVADEQIATAIMSITDRKLGNIANNLFKAADTILSGTAGAVRKELEMGLPVGGKWHLDKAEQSVQALRTWISNNASVAVKLGSRESTAQRSRGRTQFKRQRANY